MEDSVVLLGHGSGGLLAHELLERIFLRQLANPALAALEDASTLPPAAGDGEWVLTTDAYVVQPIFFPGGDIGRLAVCGTVNDLAMRGAVPVGLSAAFVLEEGLSLAELEQVVASMRAAADEAGVPIIAGDTKVVEHGSADKLFITTAGVGRVPPGVQISAAAARPGDVVLLSGAIGDHGLTIMTQREGLRFESPLASDCAPLAGMVQDLIAAAPEATHVLRDPTRGGVATALNEIAARSGVGILLEEPAIPVHPAVQAAAELMGLDPLYVANEGKLLAIVAPEAAPAVLAALRAHRYGAEAAVVGRVVAEHPGQVVLRTAYGTHRLLDMLAGEPLPRIC